MCCKFFGLLFLVMALAHSSAGRQDPKGLEKARDNSMENREPEELRQRVFQTLLSLRSEASQIENPTDQVNVLLEIADSLWLIDQEQAKNAFKQSFERAAGFDESSEEKPLRKLSIGLRQTVITRIARRDPAPLVSPYGSPQISRSIFSFSL